ncbi:PKD domain-containing protein, partial [Marinoscillum furvescens]|uniref:PKD domain-containing protein n=1 Tax=Marinoscillum furvescens TaxID=1026 RepID=UPI000E24D88E
MKHTTQVNQLTKILFGKFTDSLDRFQRMQEDLGKKLRAFLVVPMLLLAGWLAAQPTANFTATTACQGEATVFTNTSTPNGSSIVLYAWDFGGGEGSAVRDPQHIFSSPGTKSVSLTVVDENGDEATITKSVTVRPTPAAGFNLLGSDRCYSTAQSFQNLSSIASGTMTYTWNFGDGGSSTATNPTHTFSSYGEYTVMLTAKSNYNCTEVYSETISILPEPVADFSAPTSICLGEKISFTNNSTIAQGNLTYTWDFDDLSTSTEINPEHTFSAAGTYDVTLQVSSVDGSCIDTHTQQVIVHAQPVAGFSFNDRCLGTAVNFTNTSSISSGTLSYAWSFGDGNTSTSASPSHLYDATGSYEVTLLVTSNNGCTDEVSHVVNIHELPEASFTAGNVCEGNAVSFSNASSINSGGLTYAWSFGDGNTSTSSSPNLTYASSGVYTVGLTATSDFGCQDSYSQQIQVFDASVGGTVSGATTLCASDNSDYTLSLSGHTGDVIRW